MESVGTHKFEAIISILNDDETERRSRSADKVRAAPALSLTFAGMLEHAFNCTLRSFGIAGCLLNFLSSLVCGWFLVPKRLESARVFRHACRMVV